MVKKTTRRFPRALYRNITPKELGPFPTQEDSTIAVRWLAAERLRKLKLLRTAFGIRPGPRWERRLCLAMAQYYFPGFNSHKMGKPEKWMWTHDQSCVLAGEMLRESKRVGSKAEAAKLLATREPWKSILGSRKFIRRARVSSKAESGDALLKQHQKMPTDWLRFGEALYNHHATSNSLPQWQKLVDSLRA